MRESYISVHLAIKTHDSCYSSAVKHLYANGDKQPPTFTNAQYIFMAQEKPNLCYDIALIYYSKFNSIAWSFGFTECKKSL